MKTNFWNTPKANHMSESIIQILPNFLQPNLRKCLEGFSLSFRRKLTASNPKCDGDSIIIDSGTFKLVFFVVSQKKLPQEKFTCCNKMRRISSKETPEWRLHVKGRLYIKGNVILQENNTFSVYPLMSFFFIISILNS